MASPFKLALLAVTYFLIISLNFDGISVDALNIGVEHFYHTSHIPFLSKECSRKCESEFCEAPTPLLRYGKYCGLLYSGCPNEQPCDGLDACCMAHDRCISRKNNDYLSQECSRNLLDCMNRFDKTGGRSFKGSHCDAKKVIKVIKVVIKPALAAGKALVSSLCPHIGVQSTDVSVQLSKDCSRKCESEFCSVPPFLRYGKYCGLLYSGCPGEKPCDGLDACCMGHDICVQSKGDDYLSEECSKKFIDCMDRFRAAGGHTFKGSTCDANDVIEVIKIVMEAALLAGRVLKKP